MYLCSFVFICACVFLLYKNNWTKVHTRGKHTHRCKQPNKGTYKRKTHAQIKATEQRYIQLFLSVRVFSSCMYLCSFVFICACVFLLYVPLLSCFYLCVCVPLVCTFVQLFLSVRVFSCCYICLIVFICTCVFLLYVPLFSCFDLKEERYKQEGKTQAHIKTSPHT
jgi:hypothetical protein